MVLSVRDTESRLATLVEKIMDSYASHGHINHLDGVNLPSLAEVSRLVDDLFALIFPGFFDHEQLDDLSARYFVGQRSVRCLRMAEPMIYRALIAQVRDHPHGNQTLASTTENKLAKIAHEHAMDLIQSIPEIRRVLDTDVRAALQGDPAAKSAPEVITSYPGIAAIAVHRIASRLYRQGVPLLPRMMSELIHGRTGIDIHPGATIGPSFFIDHGTGVVIGETSTIGERVKLYQGVTLGALSVGLREEVETLVKRHPTLEDDVTVYAGATILGGETTIGKGSIIGGNVWLIRSIPENTTVIATPPSQKFLTKKIPPQHGIVHSLNPSKSDETQPNPLDESENDPTERG